MRILAADDDDAIARALARCLHNWGYEAVLARTGHEAWQILRRGDAPKIVILDWDMPGLSGVEVCRLLRASPHGASHYVIILTAKTSKHDLIEALEAGADDFLSKPFVLRELQLRLAKGVRDSARGSVPRDRPSAVLPPAGTTLGDKYRLEGKIAEGGMGTVWLGVHLSLGVNVAIKFMAPTLAETADYASFEREARAAAQLRSEHIVRVYDHGISHDGLPYLVMEYLAGESLAARVARAGPLSAPDAAAIVGKVARALAEAHRQGIVHRDVKPDNILLVDDAARSPGAAPGVKLIDFGLAKPWNVPYSDGAEFAGTPSYMSPECLRGDRPPDPMLDLWGLAASAFFAITGEGPFDGQTLHDVFRRACIDAPPVPSEAGTCPPAFDAWFARACAADPAARFRDADELAAALANACGGRESSLSANE